MLAKAWPTSGAPCPHVDVSLRVETGQQSLHKAVRVFGARHFEKKVLGVVPGQPQPLRDAVAISYEHAEGGSLPTNEQGETEFDVVNPIGIGFARERRDLVGQPAFAIESLVGSAPAGFAPISRNWSPRVELFGTKDDEYMRTRFPVMPEDFDNRFNCDCHPDLWSEQPMRGDEPFVVVGATPEGTWRFRLPHYLPRFDATIDGEQQQLETKLDSILIDIESPHERIVELTWRASVRLPKKSERLEKIVVTNAVDVPSKYYDDLAEFDAHDHSHQELH